jgi:sporulation protein YlmC with PRC-barrel domain
MSVNISKLYGMDIFSDGGRYLGKVYDIILDVEKGEVVRVTLESIHAVSRDDAQRIIKEKTILYKNVRSVEDVILLPASSWKRGTRRLVRLLEIIRLFSFSSLSFIFGALAAASPGIRCFCFPYPDLQVGAVKNNKKIEK